MVYWIIIWYAAFAGYYLFFKKRGMLYSSRPSVIVGWYAFMSIVGIFAFRKTLGNIFIGGNPVILVVGALCVLVALGMWYCMLTRRDYVAKAESRNVFQSKTSEIVFQQVLIWSLAGVVNSFPIALNPVLLYAIVFVVVHIPIMIVLPWKKGAFFILASVFGGIVFSLFLYMVPSGWIFALATHIAFYAFVASRKSIFGVPNFYVMK